MMVSFDRETKTKWPVEGNYKASVWRCNPTSGPTWELADSVDDVRGAVCYVSPHFIVSNVRDDACPTIPANAGIWRSHRANDSLTVFLRYNEGSNWDGYWATCASARGQTISNSANSVSLEGQYWVGSMNVWKVNSSGELKRESTNSLGGGAWGSTGIDNVNNALLYIDGSDLYAGYYDIGLWRTSTSGSGGFYDENSTDTDWAGDDAVGGNITGMVAVGSTRYVIDAPSSKGNLDDPDKEGYQYRIWKSASGGAWTKLSNQPGWISGTHKNHAYMRGLCYDGTHLYVASNGVVYRDSTNGGGTPNDPWQACVSNLTNPSDPLASPTAPIYTLAATNGLVLAGGPTGIYRSTNSGGTWTRTCTLGSIAVNCVGDTAGRGGETKGLLHSEAWTGINQFCQLTGDDWLATAYVDNDTTNGVSSCVAVFDSVGWGLLYSHDAGQSWTRIGYGTYNGNHYYDRLLRGAAFSDTCNDLHRVVLTSGEAFSSGSNSTGPFEAAKGAEFLYLQGGSPPSLLARTSIGSGYAGYPRFPVGARVVSNGDGDFFETAPGFGVIYGTVNHPDECSTTRPSSASRAREESGRVRTWFSVREASVLVRSGALELFDVSGRRAKEPAPGVYFSVKRDTAGAIVSRRTVLVTR